MARSRSRPRPRLRSTNDDALPSMTALRGTLPVQDGDVPQLRLQTLGASRLLLGAVQLGAPAGLLFMLVLRLVYTPGMAVPRDTLLRELWPGQSDPRRRGNLRQALYKLRSFGLRVSIVRDVVQLEREQVAVTFTVERTPALFERDVIRGGEPFGPFAPGLVAASDEHQEWLDATREAIHADVRRILVEQLRARRERADWSGADVLSRWLLQFDPLNEDATLTMAECTMMSGAKAEAVAILDRYLAELGPNAGDIRLPATQLRKRFTDPTARRRPSLASTERHFVGRQQELAELTLAMRRARWHDGSAVLLHGPPGIGKTRLLAELSKVAQIEGYREVELVCRESEQHRPLSPFVEVLPELLKLPGALGCSPDSLAVLRRLVGDEGEAGGGEVRADARDKADEMLRALRATSIRHAIIDLFAAIAYEKPLLLIAEDVHWVDGASWELLADLMGRLGALRVFLTLTSRYATIRQERPDRVPLQLQLRRLPALDESQTRELTRALGVELSIEPSAEVVEWLVSASEGTPLLLRALIEHWAVTGDSGGVPPSLASLLDHRFDRLTPVALRALQSISLLGRFASLDRIRAALQLPTHELIQAIDQLETADCLASSSASLVVSHELMGHVAARRMSPLVESALRASIAVALEDEYTRTLEPAILLEALQHTFLSDRTDATLHFLVSHEEDWLRCGRPHAVLNVVRAVQRTQGAAFTDRRLNRLSAKLESANGDFQRALSAAPGTLAPADDTLSPSDVDEYLSFVEGAYRLDPVVDRGELGNFAAYAAGRSDLPISQRLRAADIGLIIAGNTCDAALARRCYDALALNDRDLLTQESTQGIAILFHTPFGSVEKAKQVARSILERANSRAASTSAIQDLGRAGYVLRMVGSISDSIATLRRARDLSHEIESPRLSEYPVWQLAQISLEIGDREAAKSWTNELKTVVEQSNGASPSYIDGHQCLLALEMGEVSTAEQHLRRLVQSFPRIAPLRAIAYTMALELNLSLHDQAWVPSDALIEVATERFSRVGRYCAADLFAAGIGGALHRAQRIEEAKSLLRRYLSEWRREQCQPSARLRSVLENLELGYC